MTLPKSTSQSVTKLTGAIGKCVPEMTLYGKCISNHLNETRRDICGTEFQAFKNCVQKSVGRKW
ncbi:hypothetical protein K493DRAFT_316783 [Basidiobolus meristosporus CBS 931.73]|uniref:IMS import disulfide relay-system CHCH-CHCH-like Cx9C domain-containing protein n=1 Tax=Basidiobolus meristosporus CBS 931.73 TaxID=1314790 RepID=A0A1Y1Y313_9FUNG|nr:hypothetical protein K493DRAFT_316783 [Basidiobolus meristosporus CBS 931.73]|eukprot:ORX92106.1 hypothetical protein K493DRAFT_316783 [Basidiobolus meristosporus CBS 931.73]